MNRRKFLKGTLGVLGVGAAAAVAPKAALDLVPQEPTKYPSEPGNSYIFSDAGPELMVFPKKEVVSPEWFGAVADERELAGLTPLEPSKLWGTNGDVRLVGEDGPILVHVNGIQYLVPLLGF